MEHAVWWQSGRSRNGVTGQQQQQQATATAARTAACATRQHPPCTMSGTLSTPTARPPHRLCSSAVVLPVWLPTSRQQEPGAGRVAEGWGGSCRLGLQTTAAIARPAPWLVRMLISISDGPCSRSVVSASAWAETNAPHAAPRTVFDVVDDCCAVQLRAVRDHYAGAGLPQGLAFRADGGGGAAVGWRGKAARSGSGAGRRAQGDQYSSTAISSGRHSPGACGAGARG